MSTAIVRAGAATDIAIPPLDIDSGKNHEPKPTTDNCIAVLSALGNRIRYETFAGVLVCTGLEPALELPDGEMSDAHLTAVHAWIERESGLRVQFSTVVRSIELHARRREYNVLQEWLCERARAWDGAARVDAAFSKYWGAEDSLANRIAARILFLSLAARGLDPGCKVDTCVSFLGEQGLRKSSALRALVGPAWFSDTPPPIGNKDALATLQGVWLQEISELAAWGKKEVEQIKAYLSSSEDKYRKAYGRLDKRYPRQTVLANSTNKPDFLRDSTGNRRFPIVVVGARIDLEGIERDREQLLGEAAQRVWNGEPWWAEGDEERALDEVRADHEELDPWHNAIANWVLKHEGEPFTMDQLFHIQTGAVPMALTDRDKRKEGRAADVLHRLGFTRKRDKSRGPNRDKMIWEPQ